MVKPVSLQIVAENERLVGTDPEGQEWAIRWCGNGAYSHWVVFPKDSDMKNGFYVFIYDNDNPLKTIIEAAEKKYNIYV